ncbi:MAG: TonB-dependent receptor plug domain-containing protein [Opitutales bacterium]
MRAHTCLYTISLMSFLLIPAYGQNDGNQSTEAVADTLPTLSVFAQETANQRPVTTYESPISNLDFDPRVDMQSRNMVEAQGDLNVRGGIFEETGIQLGSATILDPQTGHYSTELPIAPEMLGEPDVLTGAINALRGFNTTVGTVSYSWSEITKRGSITAGGGDHNLNFQRIHNAWVGRYGDSKDWSWGAEIESSRSESDGTIAFGDHALDRTSGRIQLLGPDSQTDLVFGYQDKFFGLPGMYTGDEAVNRETEDIQTRLIVLNHLLEYDSESFLEASAFHRRLSDHFILRRNNPSVYQAFQETEVNGVAVSGFHALNAELGFNYSGQLTSDQIETTSTVPFNKRDYYKFSLVPQYKDFLKDSEIITLKAGVSFDDSNRDSSKISPIAEIRWSRPNRVVGSETMYLSYSETTQVLGYTALAQALGFTGDPNLRRGSSKNLELGYEVSNSKWKFSGAIFKRWDDDLVDWVYDINDTRSARHVDMETFGFELIASRSWQNFQTIGSYTFLEKDEDYGDPSIARSIYALNFPEHRATFGLIWNPISAIEVRLDNEWRKQRKTQDRDQGPHSLLLSHMAASYYPAQIEDLELFIAYDKPWDEDFQDIPGTPGRGDQFSLGGTYSW